MEQMKRVILITGPPRIGKTTALLSAASELKSAGYSLGGMVSEEVRERGHRVGFSIQDYASGRKGWLAHVRQPFGPTIGNYRINLEDLNSIGVAAILTAMKTADIVLVDEIGPMELLSKDFTEAVQTTINSCKPLLATIHYRVEHPFVRRIKSRSDTLMVKITRANRVRIPALIAGEVRKFAR